MDNTLKQRWVSALRSGKYEQGRGMLRHKNDNGLDCFCCLGVLCDIYDSSRWTLLPGGEFGYRNPKGDDVTLSGTYLEGTLKTELGISEEVQVDLGNKNDSFYSFLEIADKIESLGCCMLVGLNLKGEDDETDNG
jgi:hypothetical protein